MFCAVISSSFLLLISNCTNELAELSSAKVYHSLLVKVAVHSDVLTDLSQATFHRGHKVHSFDVLFGCLQFVLLLFQIKLQQFLSIHTHDIESLSAV